MNANTCQSPVFPAIASSPAGTRFQLNSNGSLRRMDCGDILINLFPGNEAEGGPANIHLRRHGKSVESTPLLGPSSPAAWTFDERGMTGCGHWNGLDFRVRLTLAESAPAWFWHVEITNHDATPVTIDLIHTQDIGIAHYGAVRLNEYYVSQYIDHTPLLHPHAGCAIASRQNQSMGGRYPWTVIGSLGHAVFHATDALQFHGLNLRADKPSPALVNHLPGQRLQHEHSMACIQDAVVTLNPGQSATRGFFALMDPDHPQATSEKDISKIDAALSLPEAQCPQWAVAPGNPPKAAGLFSSPNWLESNELTTDEITAAFGENRRHEELHDGSLHSFFTANHRHVVLKAKELAVLRPHGHILRTGSSLVPDESSLTSTAWMGGVFHSMVTQGHVSINRFLSTCHTYLGMFRSHGQRVFVEIRGEWHQLGTPSAFEMGAESCRWIYKHSDGVIEVVSSAPESRHELGLTLNVLAGPPCRFLITHHVAMNGDDGLNPGPVLWKQSGDTIQISAIPDSDVGRRFPEGFFSIRPAEGTVFEATGGDEMLFADGSPRNEPFLCVLTKSSASAGLVIRGNLVETNIPLADGFWNALASALDITAPPASPLASAADRVAEILPWLVNNALVHYLSPRGLEQYSGGGWGTRDVCQGPVELMLALGKTEPIRDLLCRVFRQQNPDGDWPQWFMFFDRERGIRPGDSHGDIVYWPVLALAQYIIACGDASILDECLPFFHHGGDAEAENATVRAHVERALDLITNRVIRGTSLAAYGHGDWNDSLQPAKPDMRDRLCSSWTVTLNYQTFVTLAAAFRQIGLADRAAELESSAETILHQFRDILLKDGVLTGLAYFHEDGKTDLLIHPQDNTTGLSYSLLPMIHAIINDMFTPDQALHHLGLIRDHLTGPDGARLFDRPMAYRGGIQTNFQRAESASYFGREIGIMYTHAHIRYCEALARYGDSRGFFHALSQINPIAIREIVPSSTPRQANCYYSSSDASFADRYQAFEEYASVKRGDVSLEGGWRVYSSGAGIGTRLIMHCFLGVRVETTSLLVDPVVSPDLDGLRARVTLAGHAVDVTYQCGPNGTGPQSVALNGTPLAFTREHNPYRTGGVRIPMASFISALNTSDNRIVITLG